MRKYLPRAAQVERNGEAAVVVPGDDVAGSLVNGGRDRAVHRDDTATDGDVEVAHTAEGVELLLDAVRDVVGRRFTLHSATPRNDETCWTHVSLHLL